MCLQVDTAVIRKYFIFQAVTVFIATVISGSLADEIEELIHSPSQIITVLANGAPSQAVFFMSYLLLLALTVKPVSLLRVPGKHHPGQPDTLPAVLRRATNCCMRR